MHFWEELEDCKFNDNEFLVDHLVEVVKDEGINSLEELRNYENKYFTESNMTKEEWVGWYQKSLEVIPEVDGVENDPIADKILTSTVLFMLIADGTIPAPWGVIVVSIIIAREFMVSALRLLAASKGTVLAADIWGKAKTMVQMIAIPVCMLIPFVVELGAVGWLVLTIQIAGWVLIGVATVLTVISGANYLIKNKDCFKDNK